MNRLRRWIVQRFFSRELQDDSNNGSYASSNSAPRNLSRFGGGRSGGLLYCQCGGIVIKRYTSDTIAVTLLCTSCDKQVYGENISEAFEKWNLSVVRCSCDENSRPQRSWKSEQ